MKFVTTIPLCNTNITTNLSDASQGIVKVNFDDEWTTAAIQSIKLEVYSDIVLGGHVTDTNICTVKVYDKTNSADICSLGISYLVGKGVYQSSDCKNYFSGKGEIEIHLKVIFTNVDGNIYCARLTVEMDGTVEKFVEYQTCGVDEVADRSAYVVTKPAYNLYTSGNWDGTVTTSWCVTMKVDDARERGICQLIDDADTQLDTLSSSSTSWEHKSGVATFTNSRDHRVEIQSSQNATNSYMRLPLMIFKISAIPTKFELQNVLNNYHKDVTATPWTEKNHRWLFDPAQWGDLTRTHQFETVGEVTSSDAGGTSQTRATDDGAALSGVLEFNTTATPTRKRTSSFSEPVASSEVGWEGDEQTVGYLKTYNNRHLILITNAVNPLLKPPRPGATPGMIHII